MQVVEESASQFQHFQHQLLQGHEAVPELQSKHRRCQLLQHPLLEDQRTLIQSRAKLVGGEGWMVNLLELQG
jgi:hypothetical protein